MIRLRDLKHGLSPADARTMVDWINAELARDAAQAGEAGTAETSTKIEGSVHEHAVPKGCAHPTSSGDL
jgi:hypothetical protein